MPDNEDLVESVTVFDRPMDDEGWSAELVVLGYTAAGDVVMRIDAGGKAVQMYAGDFYASEHTTIRVAAGDVARLVDAATRELFADTSVLVEWARTRQVPTEPGQWHGFAVRPLREGRLLIEAIRDRLGTVERDEASKVSGRFTRWLRANGIPFSRASEALPYD